MEAINIKNKVVTSKSTGDSEKDEAIKKIRKLKKTLRQIKDLEEKLKQDKNAILEKEQIEKINRKDAIVAEILELGGEIDGDD